MPPDHRTAEPSDTPATFTPDERGECRHCEQREEAHGGREMACPLWALAEREPDEVEIPVEVLHAEAWLSRLWTKDALAANIVRGLLKVHQGLARDLATVRAELARPARTGCDDCLDARRAAEASLRAMEQERDAARASASEEAGNTEFHSRRADSLAQQLESVKAVAKEMRHSALVAGQYSVEGPDDGTAARAAAIAKRLSGWADLLDPPSPKEPVMACMVPTPDRTGRTCDRPRGHDGDHWTYGMATLSWSPKEPV